MPHSNSAKKRVRQNEAHRVRNRANRTRYRQSLKQSRTAIAGSDMAGAESSVTAAARVLDKVVAKGVIHPNKAARLKSRLARQLNVLKAKAPSAEE